jgi:hypothetical protein
MTGADRFFSDQNRVKTSANADVTGRIRSARTKSRPAIVLVQPPATFDGSGASLHCYADGVVEGSAA